MELEVTELLNYMWEKYRESFQFVEHYGGQMGKPYTEILVKSKRTPERIALVRRMEKEGQIYFEDNYLAFLRKDDLQRIERELAEEIFGKCKVIYKIPAYVFPYSVSGSTQADQLLHMNFGIFEFQIIPLVSLEGREKFENSVREFCRRNREHGYQIKGCVRYEKEELAFSMKENQGFHYFKWIRK